jgi:hypothetical protein
MQEMKVRVLLIALQAIKPANLLPVHPVPRYEEHSLKIIYVQILSYVPIALNNRARPVLKVHQRYIGMIVAGIKKIFTMQIRRGVIIMEWCNQSRKRVLFQLHQIHLQINEHAVIVITYLVQPVEQKLQARNLQMEA